MFSPSVIRSQYTNLPIPPPSAISGRTYIVTGANTGLGLECAKHLVRLSASRVILAVRSQSRGDAAKANIEAATNRKGIAEVWLLDLSSYDSVKSFAKRVNEELKRIDGVVENASVAIDEWIVHEGLEMTLTVNVMSTFLLAMLLLPKLKATAKNTGETPRISVVSSEVGFWMGNELQPNNTDIIGALNTKATSPMAAKGYPISKLLQAYMVRELASQLPASKPGVVVNYLNPGLCKTELARNAGLGFRIALKTMHVLMGRTAEMGSRTLLHAVCAEKESHGKYLSTCRVSEDLVPGFVTGDQGQRIQKETWESVTRRLEEIVPGCVRKALES